jgi:hypothetical protein
MKAKTNPNDDFKKEMSLLRKEIQKLKTEYKNLIYKLISDNKINLTRESKNLEPISLSSFIYKFQIGSVDKHVFKLLNFVLNLNTDSIPYILNEKVDSKYVFMMNFTKENDTISEVFSKYLSAIMLNESLSKSNKSKTKTHIISLGRGKK